MDRNDIRECLHSLESCKDEIKNLQESIAIYKTMDIEYFTTSVLSDMPKAQGMATSRVELVAINRIEYMQKLQQELCCKMAIVKVISETIEDLDKHSNEYKVIICRYYSDINEDNGWKAIASKLRLDITNAVRFENRFITRVMKNYKKELDRRVPG